LVRRKHSNIAYVELHRSNTSVVDCFLFLCLLYRVVIFSIEENGKLPSKQRVSMEKKITLSWIVGVEATFADKSGNSNEIVQMMSYLNEKLENKKDRYIIAFSNFHCIDSESLSLLFELFETNNNHRYIFEYKNNGC
jgi:hypothetical protein